jgi:signal transduction histidine kinase
MTIRMYIEQLESTHGDKLDDKTRRDVTRVIKAGSRMKTLIDELLAYARFRTERRLPEPVDCAWAWEGARDNHGASIQEAGAEITADELPVVLADPTQLVQVFQNLIGNALKYRSSLPPRIHVSARRDEAAWWVIEVADNGIGIETWFKLTEQVFAVLQNASVPESVLAKLEHLKDRKFSRQNFVEELDKLLNAEESKEFQSVLLYRAVVEPNFLQKIFKLGVESRLVSASVIPGSGVGLATCETIVQRHGGRIWASSPGPNKGTTISFTMPAAM